MAVDFPASPSTGDLHHDATADEEWKYDGEKFKNHTARGIAELAPFKNKIINGAFDIWQRGTSFTAVNDYTADRWPLYHLNHTVNVTQVAHTLGDFDNAEYCVRANCTSAGSAAGDYVNFDQYIEGVHTLQGKTVTVSFWAKEASSKSITVELIQKFGSGGSANVYVTPQKQALTTGWVQYSMTFSVPSISGKTLGTNPTLVLRFWLSAGSTYNTNSDTLGLQTIDLHLANVQLEEGSFATEFERRPIGTELSLCQRYFFNQKFTNQTVLFVGRSDGTDVWGYGVDLPHVMRVNPTITFDTNTLVGWFTDDFASVTPTNLRAWGESTGGSAIYFGAAVTSTSGDQVCVGLSTAGVYIHCDAEF